VVIVIHSFLFSQERIKEGGLAISRFLPLQVSKGRVLLRFILLKADVSALLGQG